MAMKQRATMRTKGSKNKIPSKRDLTKVSIETIQLMMNYIHKHIKADTLTPEQLNEITLIFEQMDKVIQSSGRHLENL